MVAVEHYYESRCIDPQGINRHETDLKSGPWVITGLTCQEDQIPRPAGEFDW